MSVNVKEYSFASLFEQYKEMDIRFNNRNIKGIVEKILVNKIVFLVGESGIGKTYTLYRIMKFCLENNKGLPIFLHSEVFGLCEDGSLDSLIRQAYSLILTQEEIDNVLLEIKNNKDYIILIDAINEVDIKVQKRIIKFVTLELAKNSKILISGQKLLEEVLDIRIKKQMYIMEVTQENIHEEILKFAYECLKNEPEKIKKLDYIEKIDNTLIGILIIYYLKTSDKLSLELTDLFKNVIIQILNFRAKQIDYIDYTLAIDILSDLVYWHYMNEYQMTRSSIKVWYEKNRDFKGLIFKHQADFFDWVFRESIFKVSDEYVRLIHEKLGDFLVAYKIFNAINFNEYEVLVNMNLFKKDVTIRISSFLTDFLFYKEITNNFKRNLKRIYLENRKENLNSGIIYRQQAAFYLGIIGESLKEINDDSMVVRRAYIVGNAISDQDIHKFNCYCYRLVNNKEEEMVNLCYTLIHQGDFVNYNENAFEVFDLNGVECENAFKGMIKQLLKQEYSHIDILAIITINDYYLLFGTLIDNILLTWYNWNHSIRISLAQTIKKLEQIYEKDTIMFEEIIEFKRNILKIS